MEQVERIQYMEAIFGRAELILSDLRKAVESYQKLKQELDELEDYYDNGLWLKDFNDDNAGKLPTYLKRGVLSEDGVWNLLNDREDLLCQMKELTENQCD